MEAMLNFPELLCGDNRHSLHIRNRAVVKPGQPLQSSGIASLRFGNAFGGSRFEARRPLRIRELLGRFGEGVDTSNEACLKVSENAFGLCDTADEGGTESL